MEAINLALSHKGVKRKPASGVVEITTVSILGFAANEPRWHQGCSESCAYDASDELFPGQYFDEETRLHYNHFRYYDPSTGRYVQSDRIGLEDGFNTYSYVHQNPLKLYDQNGLAAANPVTGAIAGIPFGPPGVAVGAVVGTAAFIGSAALAALAANEAISNSRISDELDSIIEDAKSQEGISVPVPPRKRGKYVCIARIQDLDRASGGCPRFGWGWGIDKDFQTAKRQAIRRANSTIRAVDTHHAQWRCISPTGQILRP